MAPWLRFSCHKEVLVIFFCKGRKLVSRKLKISVDSMQGKLYLFSLALSFWTECSQEKASKLYHPLFEVFHSLPRGRFANFVCLDLESSHKDAAKLHKVSIAPTSIFSAQTKPINYCGGTNKSLQEGWVYTFHFLQNINVLARGFLLVSLFLWSSYFLRAQLIIL